MLKILVNLFFKPQILIYVRIPCAFQRQGQSDRLHFNRAKRFL
jgi:hypothetical protein